MPQGPRTPEHMRRARLARLLQANGATPKRGRRLATVDTRGRAGQPMPTWSCEVRSGGEGAAPPKGERVVCRPDAV